MTEEQHAIAVMAVAQLTSRERLLLEMRFGLLGGKPCTLQAIGDEFGITRERVRQIEAKALRKVRRCMEPHA